MKNDKNYMFLFIQRVIRMSISLFVLSLMISACSAPKDNNNDGLSTQTNTDIDVNSTQFFEQSEPSSINNLPFAENNSASREHSESMNRRETISAGGIHSAAIKTDGSLWVWGWNQHGQVGNGESGFISDDYGIRSVNQTTPIKVMDSVVSVSAGSFHTLAISNAKNSLWGWGENDFGQLGDGTGFARDEEGYLVTDDRAAPFEIIDAGVSVVSAGNYTTMVIIDGDLWAWGFNNNGCIGDGTTENHNAPVKIMDSVIDVSAGSDFTVAIKADGSLWAWGDNSVGQLGDGKASEYSASPQRVMDDVTSVSAGNSYAMAIKTDGSLWAWGFNWVGQLGDGSTEDRYTPVKIMDSASAVSAGVSHTAVIKTDGSLWTFGDNGYGQLGDGTGGIKNAQTNTGDYKTTPVKIMDSVVSVSAGGDHTLALKVDGSLWAWGANGYGQLGIGAGEERHNPVRIMVGVALP